MGWRVNLLVALLVVAPASAQVGLQPLERALPIHEGSGYYRRCVQFDPSQDKIEAQRALSCVLYLSGIDAGIRVYASAFQGSLPPCIPKDVRIDKTMELFEAWLHKHLDRVLREETAALYWSAMLENFPCFKTPPQVPR